MIGSSIVSLMSTAQPAAGAVHSPAPEVLLWQALATLACLVAVIALVRYQRATRHTLKARSVPTLREIRFAIGYTVGRSGKAPDLKLCEEIAQAVFKLQEPEAEEATKL
jgi:hypothetical protein